MLTQSHRATTASTPTSMASSTSLLSNYEISNFAFNKQAGNELSNATASNMFPTSDGSSTSFIGNGSESSNTLSNSNSKTQVNNMMSSTPTSNVSSPSLPNLQLNICNRASTSPQDSPMLSSNQINDSPNFVAQVQQIPSAPNSTVSATSNTTPPLPASTLPLSKPAPQVPYASASRTPSAANPDPTRIPTNPTPAVNSDTEAQGNVIPGATALHSTVGTESVNNGLVKPRPLSGPPANGADFDTQFGQPRARPLSVPFMLNAPPIPQVDMVCSRLTSFIC